VITGANEYKGYRGTIKDINLQKRAQIEVRIIPIRVVEVAAENWMLRYGYRLRSESVYLHGRT
jgi:hypothetical protein